MLRLAVLLLVPALVAAAPATRQVKLDGQTFTLPAGFTIERVAGPPQVDRPIVASFDDRGRLYVADSSGSNEKPDVQLKNPTHKIIRLEDTKGTGVFDKATVFADKMMFPEGILWHRGSVYVGAPPHIWKLTDTDDDGKADKREVWFDGKTVTGCANDMHGPYLGPDGWIYWCKGAFAKQEYTLPNGKKFTTRASHIFRARPDGTGIEPVMTGGMDNPVDVAFLPNGERFFTTTFFQHPAAGKRDGIIHAVYGGIYGKDHDVIHDPDHKWTSPNVMPVMTHLGPAAPCGLHCYESNAFGSEYTSNLFACQFNLRKVSRHVLKPSGSTYTTEDSDFLVSDSQDFHPTDVIEDADGSLLVVNTGGWYKMCCPSSQLVKADVLGAIYRVRKEGAKKVDDPRGLQVDWKTTKSMEMLRLLGDDRPAVRHQMIGELAARDDTAREFLSYVAKQGQPALARENALWALLMCPAPPRGLRRNEYELNFLVALKDPDASVRQVALHGIAARRDQDDLIGKAAVGHLLRCLEVGRLVEARITAEALGRIGNKAAVPGLLKALSANGLDRTLEHALTYAVIEIGDTKALAAGLDSQSLVVRRACLAALDQLGDKLDQKVVLAAMKSPDPALKETAQWIAGRHPEWADELAGVFREQLAAAKPADRDALAGDLARLAKTSGIHRLLADAATEAKAPREARTTALRAMARAGLKEVPAAWDKAIADILAADSDLHAETIATLRSFNRPKGKDVDHAGALFAIADSDGPFDVRLAAMAALPAGYLQPKDHLVERLLAALDRDQTAAQRGLAAEVLSKARLKHDQLHMLIAALPKLSPLELDRVLAAFAQTKDEAVGLPLVAALSDPALRSSLRADGVKERVKHFGPAVHKEAEKLYAVLNAEYEQQRAKLDETIKTLPAGDVRRGQAVFNSTKTSCIACHTIGYVGGKFGPDLTRIGGIRNERDLVESILFPSASFVRSYEPLNVRMKDGRVFSGVPKKDAPDEVVLILAADKEQRIAREDIDEVQPGKVSIMPAGLDKQLTPQELADLVAFLRACR